MNNNDLYQEIILDEFKHPQHVGTLSQPDISFTEYNHSCGDQVSVSLKFSPDHHLREIKWEGQGCAISSAAMSLLAAKLNQEKLTLKEIMSLDQTSIKTLLGLDSISPGREKCLLLGLRAVQNAVTQKFPSLKE